MCTTLCPMLDQRTIVRGYIGKSTDWGIHAEATCNCARQIECHPKIECNSHHCYTTKNDHYNSKSLSRVFVSNVSERFTHFHSNSNYTLIKYLFHEFSKAEKQRQFWRQLDQITKVRSAFTGSVSGAGKVRLSDTLVSQLVDNRSIKPFLPNHRLHLSSRTLYSVQKDLTEQFTQALDSSDGTSDIVSAEDFFREFRKKAEETLRNKVRVKTNFSVVVTTHIPFTREWILNFTIWTGNPPPVEATTLDNECLLLFTIPRVEIPNGNSVRRSSDRGCRQPTYRSLRATQCSTEGSATDGHLGRCNSTTGRKACRARAHRKAAWLCPTSPLPSCSRDVVDWVSLGAGGRTGCPSGEALRGEDGRR